MSKKMIIILAIVVAGLVVYFFGFKMVKAAYKSFLDRFLSFASVAQQTFGINPLFLLSQMYAENAGNSVLLNTANNPGSLISRSGTTKLPTNSYWKGDEVQSKSSGLWFRKYDTLQNGFLDYAHTLAAYYHMNQYNTIQDYANAISNSAYISEANGDNRKQYANNIIDTYNKLIQNT